MKQVAITGVVTGTSQAITSETFIKTMDAVDVAIPRIKYGSLKDTSIDTV